RHGGGAVARVRLTASKAAASRAEQTSRLGRARGEADSTLLSSRRILRASAGPKRARDRVRPSARPCGRECRRRTTPQWPQPIPRASFLHVLELCPIAGLQRHVRVPSLLVGQEVLVVVVDPGVVVLVAEI